MPRKVLLTARHGTAAAWTSADPILEDGEPGVETDTGRFKFGDGSTAWTSLAYSGETGGAPSGAAGGVLSGTYPNPGFAADMATQAELDAHTGDTSDAHDASAVSFAPAGTIAATDVQAAIQELDGDSRMSDSRAPSGSAGGVLDGSYPNPGLAAGVAGAGLAESSDVLSVNVDGSTIEINSDTLRVKDGGITYAKIQDVSATDKVLGRSSAGSGEVEEISMTAAGRALVDDADAAAQRTTLGLGTLATQSGTFSGTSSGTNTGDQALPTRASLGLDTSDSPQFAEVNVGAATDTTITRTGAGDIAVEGNALYRAGGTDVPVADGGTGSSTAAGAATNLGLGTGDSPQFTAVNIGHASDTTLARSGAGDLTVEGNVIYRAGGTDVAVADGGTGASTAAAWPTNHAGEYLLIGADISVVDTYTTIASQAITFAAGQGLLIECSGLYLNNSGSARTVTIALDINGVLVEISNGATIAASATNHSPIDFTGGIVVQTTSLTYMWGRALFFGPGAANTATTMAGLSSIRGTWNSSATNLTGAQTVIVKIKSSAATSTQTLRRFVTRMRLV